MRLQPLPSRPTHITYRLYGSIPNIGLTRLHESHRLRLARLEQQYSRDERATSAEVRKAYREGVQTSELDCYINYDQMLDQAAQGPRFLTDGAVKKIIIDSWKFIAKQYGFNLFAISVMSNHVHVLVENRDGNTTPLAEIMKLHKRFTAVRINRLHGQLGRRVWAEKEYSRTVRFGKFEQTLWYVLNNPVKAGLTQDAVSWYGNYYSEAIRRNFVEVRRLACSG
jgi:REP element-mobilizing transposase RayT